MKIKSKIYIIILISFLLGTLGFTFMTKSLGGHYYILRKKQFLNKQEHYIRDHSFSSVETVIFEEVEIKGDLRSFNEEVRRTIFGKENAWEYTIWFSPKDLSEIKKGRSITRIFYQRNLNLAFIIRVVEYRGKFYALKTNIPSVKENFNFARELNILIFIIVIIFQSIVFLFYSKELAKKIDGIKLNLLYIKDRKFDEIRAIEEDNEVGEISDIIIDVGKETEYHLNYFKELSEEQKKFLRTFGHEIKTPLTIANGYTDFLKKDHPSNPYVQIISNELVRLSKITRKFEEFSERNKELFIEEVPLKELIEIGRIFSKKHLEIGYKENIHKDTNTKISCDIELTESLFYNLYSNAFKYCRSMVSTELFYEGGFIIVSIENDGNEISEEELKKLWQPFYRLERDSKVEGSGLGLSIIKDITKKHHWDIEMKSETDTIKITIKIPVKINEDLGTV